MPTKILGIALVLHGLVYLLYAGHSLRKFQLVPGMGWPDRSWLYKQPLSSGNARGLMAACLMAVALGFAASGLGLLAGWGWWPTAAAASAAFSTLIFVTARDGRFKRLSDQGGFGVLINLAVIMLLRVLNWTP